MSSALKKNGLINVQCHGYTCICGVSEGLVGSIYVLLQHPPNEKVGQQGHEDTHRASCHVHATCGPCTSDLGDIMGRVVYYL